MLETKTVGRVRVLTIVNPPVNAMAHAVRAALLPAIIEADEDPSVAALMIRGQGAHFVAGADIREFDAGPKPPLLNDVLLRLEACRKPVVAAIRGSALGGGLELALASHYRCAAADAMFGFPEVKLGMLPGSGGTLRLPRLIGVAPALDMMLSGEPINCARAEQLGLIDRLVEGDIEEQGLRYANELIAEGAGPRPLRDRPLTADGLPADFFAQQQEQARKAARGYGSQPNIVSCVAQAVTRPFDEAMKFSRQQFEERRLSAPSRAMRHMFFAERGSRSPAEAPPIQRVAVIGSGTMGSGIAVSLATAGYDVIMLDVKAEALAAGMKRLRDTIGGAVSKGKMSAAAAEQAIARVADASEFAALRDTDLVIEAVFESMAVKQEVFAQLDAVCKPGAILTTNTSTLDVDAIAHVTRRPADVLGMHFFSPANIMRLVEIVRGKDTSPRALAGALAVTRRMGKLGIVVGNCFGFVGNRMLYAYGRENQSMLLEGALPQQIDAALKKFGMAMGPHAVGDLAGLDVGYRVRRERKDLPPGYYRVADLLVEAGRLGQKTGKGMYLYPPGSRDPQVDPEVDAMIVAESARMGIARRTFADEEIVERGMYALANEGARILEEGIADSAADIDAIWCNGYGYPRWRGGPMFYADTVGLPAVKQKIAEFGARPGFEYWQAAPLLARLADEGKRLSDWKR